MKKLFIVLVTLIIASGINICVFANEDNIQENIESSDEVITQDIIHREFNFPDEVKGIFIKPEIDFLISGEENTDELRAQIDAIFQDIVNWDFNTIYLSVNSSNGVIYPSNYLPMVTTFDAMQYFYEKAAENNIYLYTIIDPTYALKDDAIVRYDYLNSEIIKNAYNIFEEFIINYSPDAVILDGYFNSITQLSIADYKTYGAGMGMEQWLKENVTSMVKTMSELTAKNKPNTQFGIMCSSVWANINANSAGSNTNSDVQMLSDYNVDIDTLSYISDIQLLVVPMQGSLTSDTTPFKDTLAWWSGKASEYGTKVLPVIFNEKLGSTEKGWTSPDQVLRQITTVRDYSNSAGMMFNSYQQLKTDSSSTDLIVRFFKNQIKAQDILTDLTISRPTKLVYTTEEPTVSFYGASDPNFPLLLNDKEIERNEKGVFSLELELSSGENVFNFTHKNKTITYKITRNIKIISNVTPEGALNVEGGATIPVSVQAYPNSTITATIGGSTISLAPSSSENDSTDKNSNYITYTANYTAPASQASQIDVGNINISATWQGVTQTATGAMVRVAALPPVVEVGQVGTMVEITTSQAVTYPSGIINSDPSGDSFPLAKGSRDYIASDLLTYTNSGKNYSYYILKSGVRVSASDLTIIGDVEVAKNNITQTSITQENGFTYLRIKQDLPMAAKTYLPNLNFSSDSGVSSFTSTSIQFIFNEVENINEAIEFNENNLFASANFSRSGNDAILNLNFKKSGRFAGLKTYYENGYLVFKFTNIPSSLSGAKIYLDPGHGGSDPGAIPIEGMKNEATLNYEMATKVAEILRARGASVTITDCSMTTVGLDTRVNLSKNYEPHLFVSLHHNSSTSPSATGTEAWFFNPYSELYADKISASVAAALGSKDRGEKYGLYRVTTHMEFPAVLVEYGFLSNVSEYDKLKDSAYQNAMATATADAIASVFAQLQ